MSKLEGLLRWLMKVAIRKINKLRRDPKQFLLDSKVFKRTKSIRDEDGGDTEPRVIGEVDFSSVRLIETKDKKILNGAFSTLFLVDSETRNLSRAPILESLFKNKNDFIGFREKTLFVLRVKHTEEDFSDIYEKVINMKEWHSGVLASFKNVVLVGRHIKFAEFFRSSNVNCRIYAVLNEQDKMINSNFYEYIDHFFCHKSHKDICSFRKDLSFFKNTNELLKAIEQRVTQAGSKPYDYLVPIFGDTGYLENIDQLNSKSLDVYLKLLSDNKEIALTSKDFNEYIDSFAKDVEFLMMRESLMQRYASLVSTGDIAGLLKVVIKDGARVEVV